MSGDDLELRVAWQRAVGGSSTAIEELDRVMARYREPHRHYHTVRHLRWVVRHTFELVDDDHRTRVDLDAVVVAAFYHDVVYDPMRHDNERRSADLALVFLDRAGWPAARAQHVATMVVGTASHAIPADDLDTAVLFAGDLAVLAAEPGAYGDYVRNVRREYAHVDDDAWKVGRAAVLSTFSERERIYDERLGLDTWEHRARANIASELAVLESG